MADHGSLRRSSSDAREDDVLRHRGVYLIIVLGGRSRNLEPCFMGDKIAATVSSMPTSTCPSLWMWPLMRRRERLYGFDGVMFNASKEMHGVFIPSFVCCKCDWTGPNGAFSTPCRPIPHVSQSLNQQKVRGISSISFVAPNLQF